MSHTGRTITLFAAVVCLKRAKSSYAGNGTYQEIASYDGMDFFDHFNFATYDDPTHGTVRYVNREEANETGLIYAAEDTPAFIGTDVTNVITDGSGRPSVRLESKARFNDGLFVIKLSHMPTGCGTWPAFWLVGDNWPTQGEIDIIEGVDKQDTVSSTLHTDAGCDQSGEDTSSFTGAWNSGADGTAADNCDANAAGQYANQGCSISGAGGSMGTRFNDGHGGTFATEWDPASHIAMWFWPRGDEPSDLSNPASFGSPYARFALGDGCPTSHFTNQAVIFDLTFCGDWDGGAYPGDCAAEISSQGWPATCEGFVSGYPNEFLEAYWEVNHLKVYSKYN